MYKRQAYYNLEDAAEQIGSYGQDISDDPGRLDYINQRLTQIKEICRKHGGSVEQVLAQAEQYRQELDQVENKDYYGKTLRETLVKTEQAYRSQAAVLTQLRQQAALRLGKAISKELQELCMPQAVFSVAVSYTHLNRQGPDSVGEQFIDLDGTLPFFTFAAPLDVFTTQFLNITVAHIHDGRFPVGM